MYNKPDQGVTGIKFSHMMLVYKIQVRRGVPTYLRHHVLQIVSLFRYVASLHMHTTYLKTLTYVISKISPALTCEYKAPMSV